MCCNRIDYARGIEVNDAKIGIGAILSKGADNGQKIV